MTKNQIKTALEHAPKDPGPIAEHLRGWWLTNELYVCARCAGRMGGRGISLPAGSKPVWADRPEPYGICAGCD